MWVLIEKLVRLSVIFCFFSFVSQKLSVYDFGIFSLSQTITTLIIGVVAFGLDNVLIKEFSSSEKINKIFATAIFFRLALSLLAVILLILFFSLSEYEFIYKLVFVASSLSIIFQTQTIYYSYYQAVSKSVIITKTSLFALMISSAIKILLLYFNAGMVFYALSFSLDYLLSFLCIYYISHKYERCLNFGFNNFDLRLLKELIRQSLPILISTIIIMIYTRIDQFMIARYLGIEQVAIFSVAVRISDAYMFIPMAISASFLPMVSKEPTKENIQKYFDLTHFFTIASAIFVIALVPVVVNLFFGERYVSSIHTVYIIVIANVVSALGAVSSNVLIVRDLSYLRIYRAVYGLVINVLLNIYMIPNYGIIGAAYSSLLSQIIAAWLANFLSINTRDLFFWQSRSIFTFGILTMKGVLKELNQKRL